MRFAAVVLLALEGCSRSARPGVSGAKAPTVGHPLGTSHTTIDSTPGRPFGIGVSASNIVAVTQQDLNSVTLVNVSGFGARTGIRVGADPGEVIFNRAGTVAYVSGFNDGSVRRIDVAIGVPMSGSHVGPNAFRLALSADENRLYVSTTDGAVYALRTSDVSAVGATSAGGSLQGLVVAANGDLYVSATSGRISRVEAKAFAVNGSRNVGGLPQDIALTADNTELWVANESGWVDVLDAATLSSQQRILTPSARPFGLAISPDGVQVWVTSPSSGEVVTIDRATRAVQRMVSVNGVPRRIAFTPDGRTVVVANEGGWIDVIK